ncbi:MAG: hypothetical protein OXE57_20740 [Alphaproteobacteria bacterium]|nr:hypothetical protein [Alphaproteobacteria bacterium]
MGLEPDVVAAEFQPVLRVLVLGVRRIEQSGRVRHEIAELDVLVVVGSFGQVAGFECVRLLADMLRPDGQVFLAAGAAEGEGEKRTIAVSGFELLSVQGEIPLVRRLEGRVGVPGAADELVQPEGEEALTSLIPASVGGQ